MEAHSVAKASNLSSPEEVDRSNFKEEDFHSDKAL